MNDAAHHAGSPGAPGGEATRTRGTRAAPPRHARRWTDSSTVVLLCLALVAVLFTATPPLLRAVGIGAPDARSDEGILRPYGRGAILRPGGDAPPHPLFDPSDDEDEDGRLTDLDRDGLDGFGPKARSADERRRDREIFPGRRDRAAEPEQGSPRGAGADRSPRDGASQRVGVVRSRVTLFAAPSDKAQSQGEVQRGELVMVLKETGDFALIAHSGEDGILMGWAKKSEIAVR